MKLSLMLLGPVVLALVVLVLRVSMRFTDDRDAAAHRRQ